MHPDGIHIITFKDGTDKTRQFYTFKRTVVLEARMLCLRLENQTLPLRASPSACQLEGREREKGKTILKWDTHQITNTNFVVDL